MRHENQAANGCVTVLWAAVGAATTSLAWAPEARVNVHGGFEGIHRDLSVLYIGLPLIALGGALLPLTVWLITLRTLNRPWLSAVLTAGALLLLMTDPGGNCIRVGQPMSDDLHHRPAPKDLLPAPSLRLTLRRLQGGPGGRRKGPRPGTAQGGRAAHA
ncbi:hypothetical protein GCM10009535_03200 [Streptomyces thermocarboxydovorans]|uniref:DUF1648 domain-containing protein n=1 Tax=Streptomyces thermocarboxydovorans TaxID=59298 RepID=A0ABP3SAZ5_9ACTN